MLSFGNELLRKLLSAVIVFQIAFSPLAIANNDDRGTPPPPSPQLPEGSFEQPAQDGSEKLFESLVGQNSDYNPLDYFSLLRQDFVDTELKQIKSISPLSASFRVFDENNNMTKQFLASQSLFDGNFDGMAPGANKKFQLRLNGRLVHTFRVPIEAIGVLGDFIVFIEKGSYNSAENFRHISFIDLNYFRLAKQELPIFRVPVQGVESVNSFRIHKGVLYINDKAYQKGLFEFSANINRVLFNLAVNTTQPGQLIALRESIAPFVESFNANLEEAAKQSNDQEYKQTLALAAQTPINELQRMLDTKKGMTEEDLKKLNEVFEQPIQQAMSKVHNNLKKERSLIGRLGNVYQHLTVPRPAEVSSLKQKVVTVAVSAKKKELKKSQLLDLAEGFIDNADTIFFGTLITGMALAYFLPEESILAIKTSLEMVAQVGGFASGKAAAAVDVARETSIGTFSGFNPMKAYEVYLADNAWQRTGVGVSAMLSILVLVVGIPHVILNSYYLIKDFRKSPTLSWRSEDGKVHAMGLFKKLIPNFIRRQQDLHKDFLSALSADKKKPAVDAEVVSDEYLTKLAEDYIKSVESEVTADEINRASALKSRIWESVSKFTEVNLPTAVAAGKYVGTQWKKFKNIESFAGALSHFVFSFAAFTKSGVFYATTWNYFYMFRLLVLNPRMAMTFTFFPNFFRRAVATELGQVTPPSFWNGGSRWLWQEASVQINRALRTTRYKEMKEFEASIVPVEKEIGRAALKQSLGALAKYLNHDADQLVKLSEKPGMLKKLSSKDIGSLGYDAKTFFATYYDILVENATRQYLANKVSSESPGNMSRDEIKKWFIENNQKADSTGLNAEALVNEQATEENFNKAKSRIHRSSGFFSKVGTANMHHTIRSLDAETNGKIKRFVIAEQQMKKASAMARAVRANIAALLVDKPMELALLFLLTAGMADGPNKPLFDEMFGPNSAFYLSRNVFMGYLSGLLVSIFADVWVKIQSDTRVDSLGGFDQVPEGEHAKKSFLSWYRHQFTHNKNNKWWDHHKYYSEIIYHNMGPAFVLMTITGMATLGRVDLDFYFLGYITAFFLPFSGLSMKLEQTFEIASGWVLKDVPESIRNHPLILNWANKRITKLRMGFQIFYKLYENILGQFIGNLMAVTTAQNGTRALSRILFGGKTITEHLITVTTAASGNIPGAKYVDAVCRMFFAKNYVSGPLPPVKK